MDETVPKLERLAEFEAILKDYHVSEASKQILKQTSLVLLAGPTAVGRNTLAETLIETGNYYYIVSDTTRPPKIRDGKLERNGGPYFFRKEDDVLEDIKTGKFLEAAIIHNQQVSGISIRELEKARQLQKIAITEVTIDGIHNVHRAKEDTVCIFVLPPNFEEWQRRLMHRESVTDGEVRNRMETAALEFEDALTLDYYTFVINDNVDQAATEINLIARMGEIDQATQAEGRRLAERLLIETKLFLKKP